MSGNALALTDRDRAIARDVSRFGVMSRDQLARLRYFSSKTRANERLKRLVQQGYLTTRRQPLSTGGPRLVYLPGRLLADGRDARRRWLEASDLFVAHQLGLVDIHIAFEQRTTLSTWWSERELTALRLGLVPDAYLEYQVDVLTYCAFVEYDRGTETLARIDGKVRAYVNLAQSGRFEQTFRRRFFRVLMVTDSIGRLETLSRTAHRVTDRILRLTLLDDLRRQGPLAPIWRSPGARSAQSLTGS